MIAKKQRQNQNQFKVTHQNKQHMKKWQVKKNKTTVAAYSKGGICDKALYQPDLKLTIALHLSLAL